MQIGSFILICYVFMLALGMIFAYSIFAIALSKDVKRKLYVLDADFKTNRNDVKLNNEFGDIITFSMKAKELCNVSFAKYLNFYV